MIGKLESVIFFNLLSYWLLNHVGYLAWCNSYTRLSFEQHPLRKLDNLFVIFFSCFKILMSAIQYQISVATEDALTRWVLIDVSVTRVTRLIMVEPVVLVCYILVYK